MRWLILLILLVGCGSGGDGDGNVNVNLSCDDSSPDPAARCDVNINQTNPSGESSVGVVENNQDVEQPIVFSPDIDQETGLTVFETECALCCGPDGGLSEASCVDAVEGEGNVNGDCPEEVLVDAGCTPDLSG